MVVPTLTGGWAVEFQNRLSSEVNPAVELASTQRSYSFVVRPLSTAMTSKSWQPVALPSIENPSLKLPQATSPMCTVPVEARWS